MCAISAHFLNQLSLLLLQAPTTVAAGGFPGGPTEQCGTVSGADCMCGTCDGDGNCNYEGNGNKPGPVCLTPAPGNSCTSGAKLSVEWSPSKDCPGATEVELNAEPGLCPGGWYFQKDSSCQQDFVNAYFVNTQCVNGGGTVEVHTSCSCELALCMDFNGYILSGYSMPSVDPFTWYYDE